MTRVTRRSLFLFVAASVAVYVVASAFWSDEVLVQVLNSIFLGSVMALAVIFGPLVFRAFKVREFDRLSQLTLAIVSLLAAATITRGANAAWRATGDIEIIANSPWIVVSAYLAVVGSALHVSASGIATERQFKVPPGIFLVALTLGAIVAGVTAYLQLRG